MAQREAKAPDGDGDAERRRRRRRTHHVALEMGRTAEEEKCGATRAWWAATAGIAGVGMAGAGVLVWWAVAFHPSHEQLWMVPVGLVLLGTPLIAWLSLLASGACRWLGRFRAAAADQDPAVAPET
ncbi:hypothetical protein PR202_ga27224 [Eleusine coracana subsp. coracana]|uniref:Transmembrane protein n=1 Tax=Eleusine coracana subsp. coracana TaxID=191504 RepID=A0AAV5DG97_ELECO|nr:hypothetical protein PR202_ga27224 [Eleusine coracana subsp. coracana]